MKFNKEIVSRGHAFLTSKIGQAASGNVSITDFKLITCLESMMVLKLMTYTANKF